MSCIGYVDCTCRGAVTAVPLGDFIRNKKEYDQRLRDFENTTTVIRVAVNQFLIDLKNVNEQKKNYLTLQATVNSLNVKNEQLKAQIIAYKANINSNENQISQIEVIKLELEKRVRKIEAEQLVTLPSENESKIQACHIELSNQKQLNSFQESKIEELKKIINEKKEVKELLHEQCMLSMKNLIDLTPLRTSVNVLEMTNRQLLNLKNNGTI
jgi:hypothetical protein